MRPPHSWVYFGEWIDWSWSVAGLANSDDWKEPIVMLKRAWVLIDSTLETLFQCWQIVHSSEDSGLVTE